MDSDGWAWKNRAEKAYFIAGKLLFGKSAGGILNKMLLDKGIDEAINMIQKSSEKQDPKEFFMAALREKEVRCEVQSVPTGFIFVEVGTAAWKDYEKEHFAKLGFYPTEKSVRIDGRIKQGRLVAE